MTCILGDVKKWFADKGDQTHRLNYPLSSSSKVVDLGAYEGKWAASIAERYKCNVFAFEPVKAFFQQANALCVKHPSVKVYNYALGSTNEKVGIYYSKDGTSLYGKGPANEIIEIKEIGVELSRLSIETIDLIKINIEGAEYPLLDHMLKENLQNKIKDLQIQFHILDDSSAGKREAIRASLSKTHYLTYDYPFVWENWRRK